MKQDSFRLWCFGKPPMDGVVALGIYPTYAKARRAMKLRSRHREVRGMPIENYGITEISRRGEEEWTKGSEFTIE